MRIAAAFLALASSAATLTASTVPALAEESRQIIVQYSDLNLAAPAGRATLEGRIRAAARRVCGPIPVVDVREAQQVRGCHSTAVSTAWDQVSATAGSSQVLRTR